MPLRSLVGVFWNRDERRPRAPWRLLGHAVVFVVFAVAAALVVGPVFQSSTADPGPVAALAVFGLTAAVALGSVAVAGVALDRRRLTDYGFHVDRAWWRDLAAGITLGAGLMSAIFLTQFAAGWVTVAGTFESAPGVSFAVAIGAGFAMFVAVGVYEEVLFRGYYLVNVAEGALALPRVDQRAAGVFAGGFTAVGFGLLHATNPGASIVSTAFIVLYGGYLAGIYLVTGELAFPIGFHVAWNFTQGYVYGFPTSGITLGASVIVTRQSGPVLLTGGSFGPEAGLVGLVWAALSIPALAWWVRRTRGLGLKSMVTEPELRWEK